jgi:hypothetical protein
MKAHTPAQLNTVDAAIDFLCEYAKQPLVKEREVPIGVTLRDSVNYNCSVDTEYLTLILNVYVNAYHLDDRTNISVYPKHGTADKTLAQNVVKHLKAGGRFVSMGPRRLIWEL